MAQKNPAAGNQTLLLSLFILTLILNSIIIGKLISTFVILLISIGFVSFTFSIAKIKRFNKELVNKIIFSCAILSFSIFTALICSVIIPYLMFHGFFVNLFIIQYAYLLPILIVFFLSLFLFSDIANRCQADLKHIFKSALTISFIVSVIVSSFLLIGLNYMYSRSTQNYNQQFDRSITELKAEPANLDGKDIVIFSEIDNYKNNFIEDANKQRDLFKSLDASNRLCIESSCAKSSSDKAYHLMTIVISTVVIKGTIDQANEELKLINLGVYEQNFTSLDDYKTYLEGKINSSEFVISQIPDEDKKILDMLESEFDYKDIQKLIEVDSQKKDTDGLISMVSGASIVCDSNSLLCNSLSYTAKHSTIFKEFLRLAIKASVYSSQQRKNNYLFSEIYNNRGIEESTESKIIRYKLILKQIER